MKSGEAGVRRGATRRGPTDPRTLRILGLVEGSADSARTLSGIPHYLFKAFERRGSEVHRVDYSLTGVRRWAVAAATFRFARSSWRARFHTSVRSHRALSKTLNGRLDRLDSEFEVALQVFGWVRGQPKPFVLFVDQTRSMAERAYPRWLPLPAEERSQSIAMEREMYQDAEHLCVMSDAARRSIVNDYGVPSTRVTVVGGGVNFDVLPEPRGPSRAARILFVGRDFERKGGEVLLRAFEDVRAGLPTAELHLVGGPKRLSREGVTVHRGDDLENRAAVAHLYSSARVLCLPSLYEPFGLVLPEAMAHGIPCIGTDVQAIPTILAQGRAGLLVEAGEAEPLAEAILRLLTDYDLARSVGAAGRRRVEEIYTWDHVVDQMLPILARAAAGDRLAATLAAPRANPSPRG